MSTDTEEETNVELDQDFENGSLGQVTQLGPDWYQVGLRPDTWYWTHFRVRGCKDREITFALTYLPTPANRWGVRETGDPESPDYSCRAPYVSYDKKHWTHVDFAEKIAHMPNTIQFGHRFEQDEAYLCYTIPYTYTDLLSYLKTIEDHPLVRVEMIGKTREGRDVPMVSVADDGKEKETIMFISREDADEPTSNVALEGLIGRLIAQDDEAIAAMLQGTRFRIVPMTALDSVVGGSPYGGRYYMAREWFRDPPLPEIKAVKDVVADCFENSSVKLMGKLHGGQTYDKPPVWDFRVFDLKLRKLIPKTLSEPLDPVWNCFLRDAVPWVRKLTIFESFLQQTYDFWPFFSTHTNGSDPDNLRAGGARFADLLARYVRV